MKTLLLVFVSSCLFGQDLAGVLKQGEQLFVQSCSAGYCDGTRGAGGVAYVATLSGITNPTIPAGAKDQEVSGATLSTDAAQGQELFSKATRGFYRCFSCHEVAGVGIPVARPIAEVPGSVQALRTLPTPAVATAEIGGERMPSIVVSNTSRNVIFYDLTAPLPVMRTVEPGGAKFANGGGWQHSSAISRYTDAELQDILEYLRAMGKL